MKPAAVVTSLLVLALLVGEVRSQVNFFDQMLFHMGEMYRLRLMAQSQLHMLTAQGYTNMGQMMTEMFRAKRSAPTSGHPDDVNTLDLPVTFNLDLAATQKVFTASDADHNGILEREEVLVFLAMIADLSKMWPGRTNNNV